MKQTLLSIKNVKKYFGQVAAVKGINLDIKENEFFALLGASGSGKTTLLRMLAGFEQPTSGAIELDGTDVSNIPPNLRPINLMFQSYALFPHMTVEKNISYGLEMEKLSSSEINSRVSEILNVIQLSHLKDRKPDQLSGGQRQRVALARALVKRPRLLLLDEPLGALDKKLRNEMQLELKRIQHEFGITFIIVTHDQEEALVMADRVAILKDGNLLQCGSPKEIYEHPATRFAADFIGVMNFFEGRRTENGILTNDNTAITSSTACTIPSGAEVVAAVRPERMHLDAGEGENAISGKVVAMAYHGLDLQLHIDTPLAEKPIMLRLTADQAETHSFEIGDDVTVGWLPQNTHIFSA